MSQENTTRKQRTLNALDDSKLKLYGPTLREGGYSSNLVLKQIENNPAFVLNYGFKSEPKSGKEGYPVRLDVPMSPRPFRTLMNLIIKVSQYKSACSFEMDHWGHPFIWDKSQEKNVRSKDRLLIARFSIGKRDDGTVYLGVASKGKDTVEFEFKGDEYHPITQNGQPVSVSIDSPLAAQSWAESLLDVYFKIYVGKWEEPEFEKRKRIERMERAQGRQGGYNNQGNQGNRGGQGGYNNGGGNRPPQQPQQNMASVDSFDDDLPF